MPAGLGRVDIEARERQGLAPWAMLAAASRGRDHEDRPDPFRTCFQRDRDRIVHARAFRRLAYKTQVFANDTGDLLRTRLTHTMEVGQLARTVARRLRLNEDLVECIALAHDLGHPPFGHRGETLLAGLLEDHGGFDHHRQALRIVEELEVRYPEFRGLDLSWELRESIIKHGGASAVPERFAPEQGRLLEARLVDAIDSVAYDCHDIDDALRAGIIEAEALQDLALWRQAWARAQACCPAGTPTKLVVDRALRVLLDLLIESLVGHSIAALTSAAPADTAAARALPEAVIGIGAELAPAKAELEDWLFERVYRDWRVNRTFHKARRLLSDLFSFYCSHPDTLPPEHQDRIAGTGLERSAADYIAGMTDRFAQDEHQRLFAAGVRAW